jgi:hypothetical protein
MSSTLLYSDPGVLTELFIFLFLTKKFVETS